MTFSRGTHHKQDKLYPIKRLKCCYFNLFYFGAKLDHQASQISGFSYEKHLHCLQMLTLLTLPNAKRFEERVLNESFSLKTSQWELRSSPGSFSYYEVFNLKSDSNSNLMNWKIQSV